MLQPDKREALRRAVQRAISKAPSVSDAPDAKTLAEEEDLDRQQQLTAILGLQQDINERKRYAGRFFVLACCWLAIISGIVVLDGLGWVGIPFRLSDEVVLALIGSTTVNVLGILYVVANYLFPKK